MRAVESNTQGLVHVYTGNGKGKTTAAFGLALRQVGNGKHVAVMQFLKGEASSEVVAVKQLGIEVVCANPKIKFLNDISKEEFIIQKENAQKMLKYAAKKALEVDMLILDEITLAVSCGFLTEEEVLSFIKSKPFHMELVLTGRNAQPAICSVADYVSDIHAVKHPFEKGIKARKGIEF